MWRLHRNSIVTVLAVSFAAFGLAGPIAALAATAPNLGVADPYAVFGKAGVTNNSATGTTDIWGNVGADSSVTGLSAGQVHGTINTGAAVAGVQTAASAAYDTLDLGSQGVPVGLDLAGTHTINPGVYTVGATTLNGALTLDGAGVYIFRSDSSISTSGGGSMSLINGATACNVFWEIPTNMTIGTGSHIEGTIIAQTGLISLGTGATLKGRALSLVSQVTLDSNQLTQPNCVSGTLHVIKLVVNGNGGSAVASDFMVHVTSGGSDVSGSPAAGVAAPGTLYSLAAGNYTVSENTNAAYVRTFGGACDANGNVSLFAGQDRTCTIINTDIPPPPLVSGGSASGGGNRIVPLIGILKVPTPFALPTGAGPVTYNYTVWNVGGAQALVDVTVADDTCRPVSLITAGDLNGNGKLDPGERWQYRCTTTLTKTTTNTAVATGYSDDAFHQPTIATALATVVVGGPLTPPLINIVKVPSRLTPFPVGGGDVTYSYIVTNPGVVSMHDVTVTDDKCSPVTRNFNDANLNGNNNNGLLDPGESWSYTCTTNITASTRNVATAEGQANGFTALGYAFATVLVSAPNLPNTGFPQTTLWDILLMVVILALVLVARVLFLKKKKA